MTRISIDQLRQHKAEARRFACLTAYDASFARLVEQAGAELILVGDSLGMVLQGHPTTLPVTMDDMVYHTANVVRGTRRAFVLADLPFLSYRDPSRALDNAGRLVQQAGAQGVKLEGGAQQAEVVAALSEQGIVVCAHLGLKPQSVHKLGGYRVQGRERGAAKQMLHDARLLQQAGADLLVLESVPRALAAEITQALSIPVIGIGAGSATDAQILVLYDVLGVSLGKVPRFARNFMTGAGDIAAALANYVRAVEQGEFPGPEHGFD